MLGTDQAYILHIFWHTKPDLYCICVEMPSDFLVWKCVRVALILVCWSRLLIPLAAQAWKGGTGLLYDWFLDVSITLLERVMRVTGRLFMELFRVMVKASLNTQARKGSAHVTPGKLAHPWRTRRLSLFKSQEKCSSLGLEYKRLLNLVIPMCTFVHHLQ